MFGSGAKIGTQISMKAVHKQTPLARYQVLIRYFAAAPGSSTTRTNSAAPPGMVFRLAIGTTITGSVFPPQNCTNFLVIPAISASIFYTWLVYHENKRKGKEFFKILLIFFYIYKDVGEYLQKKKNYLTKSSVYPEIFSNFIKKIEKNFKKIPCFLKSSCYAVTVW